MSSDLIAVGDVLAALDGALRHAGHALDGGHVADRRTRSGSPGIDRSGCTLTRPARSTSAVGLIGQICLPSGLADTPADHTLVAAFDAAGGAVGVLDGDAVAVDVGDHRVELDLDAHLLQPGLRLLAELLAHRRQHRGRGVEQDHPRLGGVDVPERALEGVVGELGDLPGHLDAGRTGADDDERQQLLAPTGSLDRSACSNAPRMRPRSSSASSIDFMPGANSAKWSLPK